MLRSFIKTTTLLNLNNFTKNQINNCRLLTSKVHVKSQQNNNDNNDTDDGVGNRNNGVSGTITHRQLELDKVSIKFSLLTLFA